MPFPPDCERVPGFGITTGATGCGWEIMSIPPDRAHMPLAGAAACAPFSVRFYVYDGTLVEVRFFQDGHRLRRAIESIASDQFHRR